jgi:[ribosomal protein S5]-alanine N-acetyltransferase
VLRAELESRQALGHVLRAVIPESWPPDLYDADAVNYMLHWLATHSQQSTWGFYYIVEKASVADQGLPLAVGAGGYKGAPNAAGSVEVGYSVVPERRRRGYAREAVDGWLANAFADLRVQRVIAHTLQGLEPSIAVLRSAGFTFNGAGVDPDEPSAVQYVLDRRRFEQPTPHRCAVAIVD